MRPVLAFALVAAFFPLAATGQQPAQKDIPKAVLAQLKPWEEVIKAGLPGPVKEIRSGEFIGTKQTALKLTVTPVPDHAYAEVKYVARLGWTSKPQVTKVYTTEEKARSSKEWLEPGKSPNTKGTTYGFNYRAEMHYADGKWKLNKLDWSHDAPAGAPLPKGARAAFSTKLGDSSPWYEPLKGVEK